MQSRVSLALLVVLLAGCQERSNQEACGVACGRDRMGVYTEESTTGGQCVATVTKKSCVCVEIQVDAGIELPAEEPIDAGSLKAESEP